MNKCLVLLKNGKYEFMSDDKIRKKLEDINIIMISTIGINSYIPVKPNKYMKFVSGFITYRLEEFYTDTDFNYYNSIYHEHKTIEFTSLSELYTIISSIDRIDFINYIEMDNDSSLYGFGFDIGYIEVGLYDSNKDLTYYKEIKIPNKNPSVTKNFKYYEIYDGLSDLFHTWCDKILPFRDYEGYIILDIMNKSYTYKNLPHGDSVFSIKDSIYMHEIIGIFNNISNSVLFVDHDMCTLMKKLDYIYLKIFAFDSNVKNRWEDISFPYYTFYESDMIALIVYIHYIVEGLIFLMTNDFFFNYEISDNGKNLEYKDDKDCIRTVRLEIGIQVENRKNEDVIVYDHNPYSDELFMEIKNKIGV